MRPGRARRRRSGGAHRSRPAKPTIAAWGHTAAVRRVTTRRKLFRWTALRPIRGAFTTCTATFGSGGRTAGTGGPASHPLMAQPRQPENAVIGSCAAVPGRTILRFFNRATATGAAPMLSLGTTTGAFGSGGPLLPHGQGPRRVGHVASRAPRRQSDMRVARTAPSPRCSDSSSFLRYFGHSREVPR
jgi:hypothetical protein